MGLLQWLTGTWFGKGLVTLLVAMLPVLECRVAIPMGVGLGLNHWVSFAIAIVGNMTPVPFVLLFIRRIIDWMKKKWLPFQRFAEKLEKKVVAHQDTMDKYGTFGLVLLVAIPLPGTGAYTGALVAAILGIQKKYAIPAIFLGVLIAAVIVMSVTYGFTFFLF